MAGTSEFVSVFKLNGKPILPPAMTPRRRREMQEYKMKALEIERRLKEKKKEEREPACVLDNFDEEGDKENRVAENACCSKEKNSMIVRSKVMSVLSEIESPKEILPLCLQKSVEKNFFSACEYSNDGDYQEEAPSVVLTESTDLHPYLNSSMDDEICSSETECITECASALRVEISEASFHVGYDSNEGEDAGRGFIGIGSSGGAASSTSGVYSQDADVINTMDLINILDSKLATGVPFCQVGRNDIFNSCKSSESQEIGMKVFEIDLEYKDSNKEDRTDISFTSSALPSSAEDHRHVDTVAIPAMEEASYEGDAIDNYVSSDVEDKPARLIRTGSFTLDTPSPLLIAADNYASSDIEDKPARLIRTDSFTLDTPSPLLIANIQKFTVDTVSKECDLSISMKNKTFVCQPRNNSEADVAACVSPEKLPSSCQKVEIHAHQNESKKPGTMQKKGEAFVSKREPLKKNNQRCTVFERLAADAAKKAEERRKLSKKNNAEVFKVPKKITKPSSRGMRPSVSASNLRTSLSGAHRNRPNSLASRRTNSEANVSNVHRKSVMPATCASWKKNSSQVTSMPPPQKPVVKNASSCVKENAEPTSAGTSEDAQPLLIEQGLHLVNISDERTSSELPGALNPSKAAEECTESHSEKIIYCVQTSPISPPQPNQSKAFTNAEQTYEDGECPAALLGGRRRRRWSLSWSGWVTSAAEQSDSDYKEDESESCISTEPVESKCEEWEASKVESQAAVYDVCNDVSETEVNMAVQDDLNGEENPEKYVEKELTSLSVMESQERNERTSEHMLETSLKSDICDLKGESIYGTKSLSADIKEPLIPTPEKTSIATVHQGTPVSESNDEGPALNTHPNEESMYSCQTTPQLVQITPSVQKTINSLPTSSVSSVGIKETALKLLSHLVDEQDKAMAQLLEDQRQQAEKMKERFMLQQKCLVERVAHLVSSLSTPQMRKSKASLLSEDVSVTSKETMTASKIPTMLTVPLISTPVSTSRGSENNGDKLTRAIFPPERESLTHAFNDVLEEKSSKDIVNELESKLSKFSEEGSFSSMENSVCQVCLLMPSNCRCCSQEESSCSSTVREEITALSVGSLGNDTVTAGAVGEKENSTAGDNRVCSSSPLQEVNDGELSHSPAKIVEKVLVNPPLDQSKSTTREDILDLSEILEMEFRCKAGSAPSHTPPVSIDKNERNPEEIHNVSPLSTADSLIRTSDNYNSSPLEHLSSYREMYEQDLLRLRPSESGAKKKGLDGLLTNEPESLSKNGEKNSGNWSQIPNETPCPLGKVSEIERRDTQFDMLPDLKSDVLQAYLGSQTPSTGPVFLQTPLASASQRNQELPTCSTPAELLENSKINRLSAKEVQCEEDDQNSMLISPVVGGSLECKERLDLSPGELHISIRSSSSNSTSFSHEPSHPSSGRSPASSRNTHSSDCFTTASSKCQSDRVSEHEKEVFLKFGKLSAFVKGYLTRRLLKTEKVCRIKMTIRDLMMTALKIHSEVSKEDDVNESDVMLHGQILAELNSTCEDFHHIFFEMTTAQQMSIISADRQRLISTGSSLIVNEERITPRPAWLSAVTLKTIQRRSSVYNPENRVEKAPQSKRVDKQPAQGRVSSVVKAAGQRKVKTANEREHSCRRSTSRTISISEGVNSKSGRNMLPSKATVPRRVSACKASDVQTKSSRRKRRSASAGEMNRRPWR